MAIAAAIFFGLGPGGFLAHGWLWDLWYLPGYLLVVVGTILIVLGISFGKR